MKWRFADLPIRAKFLITLGIPVMGLVLLIGKQVDSNLKRSRVLGYVSKQAGNIRMVGDVADALQQEAANTVATMVRLIPSGRQLELARVRTDTRSLRLSDPAISGDALQWVPDALAPLNDVRNRVDHGRVEVEQVEQEYRRLNMELLRGLGEMSKHAIDQEVNNMMFAHRSLLAAKQALNGIRTTMLRGLSRGIGPEEMGGMNERIALYETSILLFERDASPGMLEYYHNTFQGPDVNFIRSMIGTVEIKRSTEGLDTDAGQWWAMSGKALERLRDVEARSIGSIITVSNEVSQEAQQRLVLVLAALLLVVGMVSLMALMIMRGLRSTITEVTRAAAALAQGDVRAHVPVISTDEVGQMAGSFNTMIDTIRSLSASADAIGQGNYDTPVAVRGDQDALGLSLARMQHNLKAAKERDTQFNQALYLEKEKLERANERIRVLIRETHHRVKNNLQVVSSMLRLQSGTLADERLVQVLDQTQGRVASMALIHEKLYKGDDLAQINLAHYIKELFTALVQINKVSGNIRYRTAIDPDLVLQLDAMVPMGLILNELITNSFKHAFPGRDEGFINLRLHRAGADEFDLHYSDDGTGIPVEKQHHHADTLGRSLIDSLVEQLNGFITMESDHTGTRYHIRFRTR
ncbi:MAG: nitrate- and nitrite sensing domain-containing protein [Flavobacteriales bacterium]|nr:nitrate- and nitrite sensing domain-containing protein [Flavobacteriales bacterium]